MQLQPARPEDNNAVDSLALLIVFTNSCEQTHLLYVEPTHMLYRALEGLDGLRANLNDLDYSQDQHHLICLLSHAMYLEEPKYTPNLEVVSQVMIIMLRALRMTSSILLSPVRIIQCGFYE